MTMNLSYRARQLSDEIHSLDRRIVGVACQSVEETPMTVAERVDWLSRLHNLVREQNRLKEELKALYESRE